MHTVLCLLLLGLASIFASPPHSSRIIGGSSTVIEQYPFSATLLRQTVNDFRQLCGGSVINNRAVITAAHCLENQPVSVWRIRVGSTNAHSGGTLHAVSRIILHPDYVRQTLDCDVGLMHVSTAFVYNDRLRPATIAGTNYNVADNVGVWAIGWGVTAYQGFPAEQLRHVQVRTVGQAECRNRYSVTPYIVTDNMLCTGWLDIGGRGQCQGDSGSPVLHGHVVIGITSWGVLCAQPRFPTVNVRVARVSNWIVANA